MSGKTSGLGVVDLAAAIASGRVSAETATRESLERFAAASDLNCVVALEAEEAIAAAKACDNEQAAGHLRGGLHGVPLAHKDMYYRAGKISGCGSKIRRDFRAEETSPLIARLEAAGAITIGRLHMAEFAMGPTGHNVHLGRCCNPWRRDAITGGSSSGSGAAVGAGLVPASLGSDTGGSVRLPASFCGVAGLKPTQNLLPTQGLMPLSESFDCPGALARSSRDLARLMTVLTAGSQDYEATLQARAEGLVIGLPRQFYYDRLDGEVAASLGAARAQFETLGARVIDVDIPEQESLGDLANLIWTPEAAAFHLPWLQSRKQDYSEQVATRLLQGLMMPATAYLQAKQLRVLVLKAILEGPLAACDMLLTPVSRRGVPLATEVDVNAGARMTQIVAEISALTRPISLLGLPAVTTPAGFDARGLPIGLQLIGRPRKEAQLLAATAAYESRTDWLSELPSVR